MRRQTILFTAVAALVAASPVRAQTANARIDSLFAFANDTSPGCAVAAFRNGRTLFSRGYGMADLEHGVAITPQTPFYMASVSKQFTAAAIQLLVLDGKLSLDDDVRKFVPEVPDYGTPITVRHLLHHTSGLRDYLTLYGIAGLTDFPISNADFLAALGRQRALNFKPGTAESYSNSGYVLLSILVERVSGQSLRRFADERIFQPLGMKATRFRDDHAMLIKGRALAYETGPNGYVHSVPYFDVVGDGGLFSSVDELGQWEKNFWEPSVGGPKWLELMAERGRLADGTALTYGSGLAYDEYRGADIVAHAGGLGGYNTYLMRFPKQRFSVAVLCNSRAQPSGVLARSVTDVLLGAELAPVAAVAAAKPVAAARTSTPADRASLARYTGAFFNDRRVLLRRLVLENDTLYYTRGPGNRTALAPAGEHVFDLIETTAQIRLSTNGDTMTFLQDGNPPLVLRRVADAAAPRLSDYAGEYFSPELQVTWRLTPTSDGLAIKRTRGQELTVKPAFADTFSIGSLFVVFARDGTGKIVGLEASAGESARGLRFEKLNP